MKIVVLGSGRVGTAVSAALADAGAEVVLAEGRATRGLSDVAGGPAPRGLSDHAGGPAPPEPAGLVVGHTRQEPADLVVGHTTPKPADLVVVCVPDDVIAHTAARLAVEGLPPASFVHCSGALDLSPLQPLADAGHGVGAWHPLQAFATVGTPLQPGITWGITAEDPLRATLHDLTTRIGGRPLDLTAADRARYHAAAVLAANYSVTLIAHATGLLGDCGLAREEALAALLPLMRSTLDGLEAHGLPDGLTGPAVRGDLGTIERHLQALGDGDTAALYRAGGLATLGLVAERELAPERIAALEALLAPPPDC